MFPIRINVLSDSKKAHLKRLTLFSYLSNACAIVFTVMSVLAAIFLTMTMFFDQYQSTLINFSVSERPTYQANVKKIKEVNSQLKTISEVQEGELIWSPLLSDILSSIPPGIEIRNVTFEKQDKRLSLVGTAKTRESYDILANALRANSRIDSLKVPTPQLAQKENIPFTIDATFK